jgi:hypothetical protein
MNPEGVLRSRMELCGGRYVILDHVPQRRLDYWPGPACRELGFPMLELSL